MYRYKKIKLPNGITRDEHRIIMEKYLGRTLDRHEIAHHCNDNPRDNRIENLELMLLSEHSRMHMMGKNNGPAPWATHGTVSKYSRGCRCDLCRIIASKAKAEWRRKTGRH